MKWKTLLTAIVLLAAVMITPARAQDYHFTAPSSGDFGTPTSDDTIREWVDPNVDRSKNSALIPPGFGTPSSYLPMNSGNLIPGTVGTAALPGTPGTDSVTGYPTVTPPTGSNSVTAFTELTPDLYYSDGSLGTLKIPSIGLTVKVFEGTGSTPLLKGAGHFTGTTAWEGNFCVAAHNRGVRNDFGKIHTLSSGSAVILSTKLGTRTYYVTSVSKVSDTDTSGLNPSAANMITMYTCVANQPAYRWCVRAVAG